MARIEMGLPTDRKLIAAGGGYNEGRMSPQAAGALLYLPDNVSIVFTGRIPKETGFPVIKDLIQQQRFIFLERRPYVDLLRLYSLCDAGLLLYPDHCIGHFYQAPGRLTEYLRAGLPVVCSNFPGFELLCVKYKIGVTCNPYDSREVADAINSVLDNPELSRDQIRHCAKTKLAYDGELLLSFIKSLPDM
jgi:glycosyltransferase involved in cell wall biosynthesis